MSYRPFSLARHISSYLTSKKFWAAASQKTKQKAVSANDQNTLIYQQRLKFSCKSCLWEKSLLALVPLWLKSWNRMFLCFAMRLKKRFIIIGIKTSVPLAHGVLKWNKKTVFTMLRKKISYRGSSKLFYFSDWEISLPSENSVWFLVCLLLFHL